MTETPENVVRRYLERLIGKRASSAWLACNSLIIDVESESRERKELYVWFEPTWHIRSDTGVILGSRQAQVEDKNAHAQLNSLAAQLNGRTIEGADLDPVSHDIELRFSGGYALKTFVAEPADEEIWHIRDDRNNVVAGASPSNYFVRIAKQFVPPEKK